MKELAAWREHDVARAIHPLDREAIGATESARVLVLDLLAKPQRANGNRDLYNACARLGRLLADAGASPTLAVTTIDGAAIAIGIAAVDLAVLGVARASVAEGYFAARSEAERKIANDAWDWPACRVRIDETTAAITCGYPDDGEALADWAARVALGASKERIKEVVLSGATGPRTELESALSLVGIAVRADATTPTPNKERGNTTKSWLRLPWRK